MSAAEQHVFETFDNQFYPTPKSLGMRMFKKFKNRNFIRFLEPEAGRGDLVEIIYDKLHYTRNADTIDCIEINSANQAILREKGYRVVATDFLSFRSPAVYSHILMNPNFRDAAKHVLHAWDILLSGEISACIGAHTLKNPRSPEARQLVSLIADHQGEVEFVHQAFMTDDTKRTTQVEVALVWLEKKSTDYFNFVSCLEKELEKHHEPAPTMPNEVMLPKDFITNQVLNFHCAAEAIKTACMHNARANVYCQRFDMSILEEKAPECGMFPAESFNDKYNELKERAWSTILRSSKVCDLLSSQAQKRVEADFKKICELEFTYENIWSFIDGMLQQQGQIQIDMVCDVFDMISRYHSENRAYYQGWKSNDKHRLNAFRIKTTRFILPRCGYTWSSSLSWDDEKRLSDFDKVFALMDKKKPETTYTLQKLFKERWDDLRAGDRLSSDYFDIRFYQKRGTIHFFPRRKDLIDKLNELVGKKRQWLPHDKQAAPPAFWQQYNKAEAITARMGDTDADRMSWRAFRESDEDDLEARRSRTKLFDLHMKAMQELGIQYDPSMLLAHQQNNVSTVPQLTLFNAA